MNLERKIKPRDAKANPVRALFVSVFVMFVVSGLMLLLLAALLYKVELTESAVKIGTVIIYVVSGFVGGLLMGKIMREKKYLWGFVSGVVYFCILFLASALVKGSFDMDTAKVMTTLILSASAGMVGGMIG